MTQQFFTVLTNVGAAALANSIALGLDLTITSFAVGDGGGAAYNPTVEQLKLATDLANVTYSGGVNELKKDPDNPARFYIEGVVPVAVGGWTVREAGWYLDNGTLFAITKFPPSYKTVPADGAATELPVRTYIATGAVDNITLKIDPTIVLASRKYVDQSVSRFAHKLFLNPVLHICVGIAQREVIVFDQGQSATVTINAAQLQPGDIVEVQKLNKAGRVDIVGTVKIDVSNGISELNHWLPDGKAGTLIFECVAINKLKYLGGY
jgi:phage-related tail fiber protein